MAATNGHIPAHIANPISDKELYRQLNKGNLLAYERATDAQLEDEKEVVRKHIKNAEISRDDFVRYVGMNTLYATVSVGATLWFGVQNLLKSSPKVGRWLADLKIPLLAPNGFLREAKTLVPYVADVAGFYDGIAAMASKWALVGRGESITAATKGSAKFEILTELCEHLKSHGFLGGVDYIESFLEQYKSNTAALADFKLGEFIESIDADVLQKDKAAGRAHTPSLAQKALALFVRAEEIAGQGTKGLATLGESIKASIQEELTRYFNVEKVSNKISQKRIIPAVGIAAGIGALGVGYFSLKAAKERRSVMNVTDLSYIERVQHNRNSYDGEALPQEPLSEVDSCSIQNQQRVAEPLSIKVQF